MPNNSKSSTKISSEFGADPFNVALGILRAGLKKESDRQVHFELLANLVVLARENNPDEYAKQFRLFIPKLLKEKQDLEKIGQNVDQYVNLIKILQTGLPKPDNCISPNEPALIKILQPKPSGV